MHRVLNQKGTSTEVEHSFDMWKVYIHVIVLELCVNKRKKKEDEQNQNFHVGFSQLLDGLAELSGHFYNRTAKAFSL